MANKALAKRQRMTIRVEPSQKAGKARPHRAPPARKRAEGSTKPASPTLQERLLKKWF